MSNEQKTRIASPRESDSLLVPRHFCLLPLMLLLPQLLLSFCMIVGRRRLGFAFASDVTSRCECSAQRSSGAGGAGSEATKVDLRVNREPQRECAAGLALQADRQTSCGHSSGHSSVQFYFHWSSVAPLAKTLQGCRRAKYQLHSSSSFRSLTRLLNSRRHIRFRLLPSSLCYPFIEFRLILLIQLRHQDLQYYTVCVDVCACVCEREACACLE